jgi:hypothetical protein
MRLESDAALEANAAAYDQIVDEITLPDRFCTSSDWILPARRAFAADAPLVGYALDAGYAPMISVKTALGRTYLPLEASWGLACPLVAREPRELARELVDALTEDRGQWDAVFLSGLARGGPAFTALVHTAQRKYRLGLGQPTARCVASLEGGLDGFLGRRTAHHRKNLRRATRLAAGQVRFERLAPTDPEAALALYARVLEVESRSWKGQSGHGIQDGAMRVFYAEMVPRLARAGRLRLTFAYEGDQAVGYVLGGVRGDSYRGLQISFDDRLSHLSVGNLLQLETISGLCEEGCLNYDLGTAMPYKKLWAEREVETVPLVLR